MNKTLSIALITSIFLFAAGCSPAVPSPQANAPTPVPVLESPATESSIPTPTPGPTASPTPIPCTVAFDTDRDGNREIYTVGPDGQNMINLTQNPADATRPVWSPDGSAIAFVSDRESQEGGGKFIFVLDLKTRAVRQLTHLNGSDWPDWSPDGSRITFMAGEDIFVISADGSGKPANLTNSPEKDYAPAFSPDSSQIAWIGEENGRRNIFVMDVAGGGAHPVTDNDRIDRFEWTFDGSILTGWGWKDRQEFCHNCVVSADGQEVADAGGKGSLQRYLPFWTPEGEPVELVNTDLLDGNNEIYLVGRPFPDTHNMGLGQLNLTNNPADDRSPDWPTRCGPGTGAADAAIAAITVEKMKSPDEIVLGYAGDRKEDWQRKTDFQTACDGLGIRCVFGGLPELISRGVDAVVQNGLDRSAGENLPDLRTAAQKGIPVIMLDVETGEEGMYTVAVDRKAWITTSLEWMFAQMGGKGQFAYYDLQPEKGDAAVVEELLKEYPGIELVSKRAGFDEEIPMKIDVNELVKAYPGLGAVWSNGMMSEIVLGMADTGIPSGQWPLLPCEATKRGLFVWKDRLKDFREMQCIAVSIPPGAAYDAAYAAYYLATGSKIRETALNGKFGGTLFVAPVVVTSENLAEELKKSQWENDDYVVDARIDPQKIRKQWFEN